VKPHEFAGVYFHLKGHWDLQKCMWPLGPTKVSVALGTECTHKVAMTATAHTMTSPLKTNDQLNFQFDFFNSILLIR